MFGIPIGLLIRVGLVLAVAALAAWGYHLMAEHFREQGRAEIRPQLAKLQAEWAADKAMRNKAIADQTALWDAQRQKTEVAEHERDKARSERFTAVPALSADVARTRVPGAFVGVLNAAAGAANAAGPAREPDQAAQTPAAGSDLGLIADWFTEVAMIHAECRDRVAAWIEFYSGLRAAQPKEGSP